MSRRPVDVRIGKFDLLATSTCAQALLDGSDEDEAKQRGMVAAIMGPKARRGHTAHSSQDDDQADKQAAERKKTTITAGSFDKQVAHEMG